MPMPAIVCLSVLVLGSILFIGLQLKELRLRNRNIKHWERDEPLEGGAGDWD